MREAAAEKEEIVRKTKTEGGERKNEVKQAHPKTDEEGNICRNFDGGFTDVSENLDIRRMQLTLMCVYSIQ